MIRECKFVLRSASLHYVWRWPKRAAWLSPNVDCQDRDTDQHAHADVLRNRHSRDAEATFVRADDLQHESRDRIRENQ